MTAPEHLSPTQFAMTRPADPVTHKLLAGTLKQVQYPDEVTRPLYHGTSATLGTGEMIEPGHPGNFVRRMKHVYATEDLESARRYAYGGARSAEDKPHVYEVSPTGPIGHRADARNAEWATEYPLKIKGRA